MNTQHLKYAVEVERTGSITQAADNLYMAQPNLSKAIKELEDTLGISIFRRTSKGVVPTEKGAELLVYAKRILTQLEKVEALNLPRTESRQSFGVSVPRVSYIAKAVTRFVASLDPERELDVNVQETGALETIAQVAEGQFNLGVVRYRLLYENYFMSALAERELKSEPIWEADCLLTVCTRHPLAQKRTVLPDDLAGYIELVNDDADAPCLRMSAGGIRRLRRARCGKSPFMTVQISLSCWNISHWPICGPRPFPRICSRATIWCSGKAAAARGAAKMCSFTRQDML